jgi:hypothetical protein
MPPFYDSTCTLRSIYKAGLAQTGFMTALTQVDGYYNSQTSQYDPPPIFESWAQVLETRIQKHGCRLSSPSSWYRSMSNTAITDPCSSDLIRLADPHDSSRKLPALRNIITVATCFSAESLAPSDIVSLLKKNRFLFWQSYLSWIKVFELWKSDQLQLGICRSEEDWQLDKHFLMQSSLSGICYYLTWIQRSHYWAGMYSVVMDEFVDSGLPLTIASRLLELV